MAQIFWKTNLSGKYAVASDWSDGVVPGPGDTAILGALGGAPYTVTVANTTAVGSIQTAPNALLDILAGYSISDGTGTGANAGAIRIEDGGSLTLAGTIVNTGSIELFGTVSPTSIVLAAGGVTLLGSGAVFLNFTGGEHQSIVPATGGSTLTLGQRISGQGVIGGPGLSIDVQAGGGFLEAKGGPLTIDTGTTTIVNDGLIDAEGAPSYPYTPGQGLVLSPVLNNGIVEADGQGSTMTFEEPVTGSGHASITGGLLRFNSSFTQNVGFTGTTGTLYLARSATYSGLIIGLSKSGGEYLDLGDIEFVQSGEGTFSGTARGGVLTVSDGVHAARISLQGDFTGSAFVASPDGAGGVLVTDELKSVHWLQPADGTFSDGSDWSSGAPPGPGNDAVFDAQGAAYAVTIDAPTTVAGLQMDTNAVLDISGSLTANLGSDGGSADGRVEVADGGDLTLGGMWDSAGEINLGDEAGGGRLTVEGALTLTGGGQIDLTGLAADTVEGSSTSAILTISDEALLGGGDLGGGELELVNGAQGRIVSWDLDQGMVVDTGVDVILNAGLIVGARAGMVIVGAVDNEGVLKTNGGDLTVQGAVTGAGKAVIVGGTLRFETSFNETVTFLKEGGELALSQSTIFTSVIGGIGADRHEILDLGDVLFTGPGEAHFTGFASTGVLTVSDGVHSAKLRLHGSLAGTVFVTSDDGHGGTLVTVAAASAAVQTFAAAMAGQATKVGAGPVTTLLPDEQTPLILAARGG